MVLHHEFLNSEEPASAFSGKAASATVILSEIEPLNYSFCIHKMIEKSGEGHHEH